MNRELVIFDLDNTIVKGQSQHRLLAYLYKNRIISPFHYFRVLLWFVLYKLSIANSPEKVMSFAFSFLNGKTVEYVDALVTSFYVEVLKEYLYPQAIKEIKRHQLAGRDIVLLSNVAHPLADKLSSELNLDDFISTRLEVKDGIFTGRVYGNCMYGKNKVVGLEKYLTDKNYSKVYGYADHFSDLGFLQLVDIKNVVNPDRRLRKVAESSRWNTLSFDI